MTIEGNWIKGAMKNDYPEVKYKTVELPAGPKGKGTLPFTQCWGVAADSKAQAQAVDLVKSLSTRRPADGVRQRVRRDAEPAVGRRAVQDQVPRGRPLHRRRRVRPRPDQRRRAWSRWSPTSNSKLEGFAGANIPQVLESFDTNASAALEK